MSRWFLPTSFLIHDVNLLTSQRYVVNVTEKPSLNKKKGRLKRLNGGDIYKHLGMYKSERDILVLTLVINIIKIC
jgi:hypothetical protein